MTQKTVIIKHCTANLYMQDKLLLTENKTKI